MMFKSNLKPKNISCIFHLMKNNIIVIESKWSLQRLVWEERQLLNTWCVDRASLYSLQISLTTQTWIDHRISGLVNDDRNTRSTEPCISVSMKQVGSEFDRVTIRVSVLPPIQMVYSRKNLCFSPPMNTFVTCSSKS